MEAIATSALAVPASNRTSPELTNRFPLIFFLTPSKPSTCTTFDVATGSWATTLAVGHASKHPANSRIPCKGLAIGVSPDECFVWLFQSREVRLGTWATISRGRANGKH